MFTAQSSPSSTNPDQAVQEWLGQHNDGRKGLARQGQPTQNYQTQGYATPSNANLADPGNPQPGPAEVPGSQVIVGPAPDDGFDEVLDSGVRPEGIGWNGTDWVEPVDQDVDTTTPARARPPRKHRALKFLAKTLVILVAMVVLTVGGGYVVFRIVHMHDAKPPTAAEISQSASAASEKQVYCSSFAPVTEQYPVIIAKINQASEDHDNAAVVAGIQEAIDLFASVHTPPNGTMAQNLATVRTYFADYKTVFESGDQAATKTYIKEQQAIFDAAIDALEAESRIYCE
jgi:hypothetical protein